MSEFTGRDIEVGVMTRNRASLLKESLESLASQTAKGIKITVYDNAGDEDSLAVVRAVLEKYPEADISHFRHEKNVGFFGNFRGAIDAASRSYIILAHDDDVFHPRYVEYVLKALNSVENLALITTHCTHDAKRAESEAWGKSTPKSDAYLFENYRDLAAYYVSGGQAIFASAVYRVSDIRREFRVNQCGKIGDTNYVVDCARGGRSIVFIDGDLFYSRVHSGQDTNDHSNGPYENEILALHNYFRSILFESPKLYHKFVFEILYAERFYKFLRFSGMSGRDAMRVLKSLNAKGVKGVFFSLYPIPVIGGVIRFILRFASEEKKLSWRRFKTSF